MSRLGQVCHYLSREVVRLDAEIPVLKIAETALCDIDMAWPDTAVNTPAYDRLQRDRAQTSDDLADALRIRDVLNAALDELVG